MRGLLLDPLTYKTKFPLKDINATSWCELKVMVHIIIW